MSNVSYDLDTSGGLMPLIRALIKPPDEELNVPKAKKPQHPYYKRPGKGHNHDSCDACGEGGDLICCDRCPASFHLGCYDPPLEENDIPVGLWLCRECSASDADRAPSSRGSRAHSPADNKAEEKKTRSLRNRANSTKKTSKDGKEKSEEKEKEPEEKEKELTPMEALVKAARIMNPKQFELPTDMKISCVFPGTDKESASQSEWGPAGRWCHACDRSCRPAPLVQCDYCPLVFHQDCLDPPLTALPTGRWMCPNHVEQYIDWKMVSSVSCSARAALWARWGAAVEPRAAQQQFLRRARAANPRFRIKIPVEQAGRVVVPAMVRAHYNNPPPLIPARREYVRCRNAMNFLKAGGIYSEPLHEEDTKTAVCVNLECPQYSGGQCPHVAQAEKMEQDKKLDTDDTQSSSDTDSDFEQLAAPPKRRRVSGEELSSSELSRERVVRAVQRQLRALDDSLVSMMAWQRLQQVAAGEQALGAWRRCPLSRGVEALVARALPPPARAHTRPALPSDLLGAADRERIARCVWGAPAPPPPPPPPPRPAQPSAPLRALLAPLLDAGGGWHAGAASGMRLSRLRVGVGGGCDVILPSDKCSRLSELHAVIYHDQVTGHFELLNYSEWGTRVNGVLYACDVTAADKRTDKDVEDDDPPAVTALNDLLKDKMPKIEFSTDGVPTCRCRSLVGGGGGGGAAWEGAALVGHGALLQFGCVPYVFCVADVAN